jgi:hypothetical protein
MELRFACASVRVSLSGGDFFWDREPTDERSPFHLSGLACAYVESRFHPPDEWDYLSHPHIWTIERLPLRASVHAYTEAQWDREMMIGEHTWPASLVAAATKAIGDGSDDLRSKAVTAAFNARMAKARAMAYYRPPRPDDEYARWRDDRFDAALSIGLRMDAAGWQRWNDLWTYRHDARVPACSVTIDNLSFSKSDADAAHSGIPTWSLFIAGEVNAPAPSFDVRVAPTWDEIAFSD